MSVVPQNCTRSGCGHSEGLHQPTLNAEVGRCWACECEYFEPPKVCTNCGHELHDKSCNRLVYVPREDRDPYQSLASKLCGCMML